MSLALLCLCQIVTFILFAFTCEGLGENFVGLFFFLDKIVIDILELCFRHLLKMT